jgi:sugar phosphate permease
MKKMPGNFNNTQPQRGLVSLPFYYGWFIVGLSFIAYLVASAIRSAPAVLIHPLEAEFGWGRTAISSAASLNLLIYGFMAPVGGWLLDRFGPRRVILWCLATIAVAVSGTMLVRELWQFLVVWGIVLGVATGITPSLAASVTSRWFIARRGLALGILSNANAAGQAIYLPLLMAVIVSSGWRAALMTIVVAAVVLLPAIWLGLHDKPSDIGLEPFKDGTEIVVPAGQAVRLQDTAHTPDDPTFSEVFRNSTFWLLSGCFFVCGVTANGLVGTHMIPHAVERGIAEVTAATAFGIMGLASFIGTTGAGWLVDRVDARKVLSAAYFLRGISLFVLPFVTDSLGLFVFAVLYGLDWFATGPATTAILVNTFGQQKIGRLFGLVFVSHQIGAAVAAVAGGWAYMQFGEYFYAFLIGAFMGLLAAGLALTIRSGGHRPKAIPVTGELAQA